MPKIKNWEWRPPRVRFEPPTLQEAMAAAQGMTDVYDQQIEIASGLLGVPTEALRREYPNESRRGVRRISASPSAGARTVVVERKARRTVSALSRS